MQKSTVQPLKNVSKEKQSENANKNNKILTYIPYFLKLSEKIQDLGRKFNIIADFKTENTLQLILRTIKKI